MIENLADDDGIFNAGDDLHGATAGRTGGDVDVEYPLEGLCPGHGPVALDRGSVRCLLGSFGLASLTTSGRSNQCPVFTVGCEYAMKSGEVGAGFRYQGGEAGDEIQRRPFQ